jgi:glycogen(starch) synthase
VGSGHEAEAYRKRSNDLGLNTQVTFFGAAAPVQVAEICTAHKVAVVPSLCEEAFGLVALEAIACGCAVVRSMSGGLPEAIGPCGVTYATTSVNDLAARLEQLVLEPRRLEAMQKYAQEHLARHTRTAVAARYLRFMSDCFPDLAFAEGRSANTVDSFGLVEGAND